MFSTVEGLPLHPLVVHVVVVLVPLSTLGALLVAVRPRWARPYGPVVAALAVAAAAAAWVAQRAGNALEPRLGYTGAEAEALAEHGRWGVWTVNLSIAFAVLAVLSTVLAYRAGHDSRWPVVAAGAAFALGAAATVATYLAGESGARSVWGWVQDAA